MKKELIDIINRLKNSPSILISVINKETGQPLVRSFSADRFVEKYGSVEAFFNSLVSEGISQIIVEERRKLGNTTRSFSEPKTFMLGPKEEDTPPQATPEVMPATISPAPLMGLSFPQMMDLHVKAHDQGRLEVENKFLKEKNEKLEQEIAALKEERLADKFSEAKAKGNNEMLLGIVQNLPMLMGAFKGGAPTGLQGADGELPQVPEGKGVIIQEFAQTSPEVDSFMLKILHLVFESKEFYEEVSKLVSKYETK